MNRFLNNNLPWKIVSVGLSTLLWFFVITTQNPLQPKEIRNISVNIKGINEIKNKGYVIQNEEELRDETIRVVVRGPRLELERLEANKEGLIDVTLDLAPLATTLNTGSDTVERQVAYGVNIFSENITVEEVKPAITSVVFEKEESVTLPVRYNVYGNTNQDYMALEPIIKPSTIEITGPKSEVEKIDQVSVDINIDDFSEDVLSYTLPVKVLDESGEELTGLQKSPQYVDVTLPIGKKKIVPVEAQFSGQLQEGYVRGNVLVNPQVITIVGKASVIDEISSIKLESIALDNITKSTTARVSFLLPDGVEYIDYIEDKAVVTVEIQEERDYEYIIEIEDIDLTIVGVEEGRDYEILDKQISLRLGGTAENLLKFDPNNLSITVDVGGLQEGEHAVLVDVPVPDGVTILNGPITIRVGISEIEDEEDDDIEIPSQPDTDIDIDEELDLDLDIDIELERQEDQEGA